MRLHVALPEDAAEVVEETVVQEAAAVERELAHRLDFLCLDLEKDRFDTQGVDLVIGHQSIHHVSGLEALFDQLGLNKREAKELVDLFFEEVRMALEDGAQIKLSGFGNFDLRSKNQRPGRNPKTGEEIPISARRVVTFRPGQKLKARVEEYAGTDKQ